jgi:hypothetical protein
MSDMDDCARNLVQMRSDSDWTRFDAGVQDFLMRDTSNPVQRRRDLADAYHFAAPKDDDGFFRILEKA